MDIDSGNFSFAGRSASNDQQIQKRRFSHYLTGAEPTETSSLHAQG